ncbi:bis(5'-adenosyl)-triphosphatase enpp4-like [Babylonia areolata]|uniref:bis(5'-adenosyl)-triphosphatase enpp4-like n=1 Tax=Babylonia areolata TaxID=304850 RepID=UPI003FD0BB6A
MAYRQCFNGLGTSASLLLAITALQFSAWHPGHSSGSVDAACTDNASLPKLLLISLDGFGWHFLGKAPKSLIPNFRAVMDRGVHVRWVENVFPTKTKPNHMSLVTGLYPESHGIVNNKFFDPVLNATMPGSTDPLFTSVWTDMGAEPIWVTNSKAGNGRRSGTVYWPLSEVKIKGLVPDEMKKQELRVSPEKSYSKRIDTALDWLTNECSAHRVNFAAVYTHGVDEVSHKFGPDSQEMLDGIATCDRAIGNLLSKLKEKKLEEELNVIITADHGHSAIYPQQIVNIDDFLDPSWYDSYPDVKKRVRIMVNLWPREGFHDKVVDALKGNHVNLHVDVKGQSDDLVSMHYSENRRIAPVVLYAEPGWVIGRTNATFKFGKGEHGWDPRYDPFMYPMFMAMGPAFRKGVKNADPFRIVDIYPLMCHLLGLDPAPNNGSLNNTAHILRSPPPPPPADRSVSVGVIIGVFVAFLAVAVIIWGVIRKMRQTKNVRASYKLAFTKDGSAEDLIEDGEVVLSDEEL